MLQAMKTTMRKSVGTWVRGISTTAPAVLPEAVPSWARHVSGSGAKGKVVLMYR